MSLSKLALTVLLALVLGTMAGSTFAQASGPADTAAPAQPSGPQVQDRTISQKTVNDETVSDKTIIVVAGTFEPAPLEQINRSVGVTPVLDTAPLYHSWTEALQNDASLDLRQRGQNGIQGDLSVRGSTFGQTLILVDGLRVNDAQTAHHNLDVPIPLDGLERLEGLRGSGSTLYGADAIGGAGNLIPATTPAPEIRFGSQVGNFGVNSQNLDASFLRGTFSEQLTLWRDFSTGFLPDPEYP